MFKKQHYFHQFPYITKLVMMTQIVGLIVILSSYQGHLH